MNGDGMAGDVLSGQAAARDRLAGGLWPLAAEEIFFLGSLSWIQPGWGLGGLGDLLLCPPCWVPLPCFPLGPSQLHQGSEEAGGPSGIQDNWSP